MSKNIHVDIIPTEVKSDAKSDAKSEEAPKENKLVLDMDNLSKDQVTEIQKQLAKLQALIPEAKPKPHPKAREAPAASFPDPVNSLIDQLKKDYSNPSMISYINLMEIVVDVMKQAEKVRSMTGPSKKVFVKSVLNGFGSWAVSQLGGDAQPLASVAVQLLLNSNLMDAFIDQAVAIANSPSKLSSPSKCCC